MSVKTLSFLSAILGLSLISQASFAKSPQETQKDLSCIQRSQWISPLNRTKLNSQQFLKTTAQQSVVLLGEQHPDPMHHRWQLQTITQLYAHNTNIVLGFEMFPRRIQPVLDAWVRGELNEEEFLEKSEWEDVWKYDADLYLPIFHFARMNRLPMIALNVERKLISNISRLGWDAVTDDEKEGVQRPRTALPEYVSSLKKTFALHSHGKNDEQSELRFQRFMEAQLTWDAAMAQAIQRVQKMGGTPLVIGIIGSGHLTNRHGVPHQLGELNHKTTVLLPWTLGTDCKDLSKEYGDGIFGLEETDWARTTPKPRLGIRINQTPGNKGILIDKTIEDTVAHDAGLLKGDIIIEAAGQKTSKPSELITIIQRQAPGTWLPLKIKRARHEIDIIAKFPNPVP